MCDWGDDVRLRVPIPADCSHTGEARWDVKPVDRCIAPIVEALNEAGIHTGGSCCGHGRNPGFIGLHDGTVLTIQHRVGDPRCGGEISELRPGPAPSRWTNDDNSARRA